MIKLKPTLVITLSFLSIILFGAILLSLPVSSSAGSYTKFIDAFFTANSAVCVTGLNVLDTGPHFSLFGKFVILALIQLGGLGYMTFSIFMVLIFRKKMFITEKIMMQEMLNIYSTKDVLKVIRKIFSIVLLIEGVGATILFLRWIPEFGLKKAAFWGLFHSVSAFNNAGFALPAKFANLTQYVSDPVINLTITSLIIIGGIGFFVIADIIETRKFSLQSRVVLWSTLGLIAVGTLVILAVEYNNPLTMANLSLMDKFMASYFQAVSPRTAGFNTLDIAHLSHPTLILLLGLMFIGASPGGTGGGIKTTTFSLIVATIWATLHNQKNTVISERRIPPETVRKAFAIFFLSIILVAVMIFLMFGFEKFTLMEIAFEVFSAFGTVGLSMGITPLLTDHGKIIIMVTMFLGRVGTLSILSGISSESKYQNTKYPKEGISIG